MKNYQSMSVDEYVDVLKAKNGLNGGDYERLREITDPDWLKGWNLKLVGNRGRHVFKWSLFSVDKVMQEWKRQEERRALWCRYYLPPALRVTDGLAWSVEPYFPDSNFGLTFKLVRKMDGCVVERFFLPEHIRQALKEEEQCCNK